jgi:hypothetical protein
MSDSSTQGWSLWSGWRGWLNTWRLDWEMRFSRIDFDSSLILSTRLRATPLEPALDDEIAPVEFQSS